MKELRCEKCNTKKNVKAYKAVLGYEYDDEIYYEIPLCGKCAEKHNLNRSKHGYKGNLASNEDQGNTMKIICPYCRSECNVEIRDAYSGAVLTEAEWSAPPQESGIPTFKLNIPMPKVEPYIDKMHPHTAEADQIIKAMLKAINSLTCCQVDFLGEELYMRILNYQASRGDTLAQGLLEEIKEKRKEEEKEYENDISDTR